MTNGEVRKEFVDRFKFLYENAGFIVLPFLKFEKDKFGAYISSEFDNKMCVIVEQFLLDDKAYYKTPLYGIVTEGKLQNNYCKQFSNNVKNEFYFYCDANHDGVKDAHDSKVRYFNYLLDIVESYSLRSIRGKELTDKKINVLEQYGKILDYIAGKDGKSNSRNIYIRLPQVYSGLGTSRSNFIDYINDACSDGNFLSLKEKEDICKEVNPERIYQVDKVYVKRTDN